MKEIGLVETILQETQTLDYAGPSPTAVASGQHLDLQHIAWLRPLDPDRAGERVDACAVDGQQLPGRHARPHLAATGVSALERDSVARLDTQPGRERAVPHGVRWFGGEHVFRHDSPTRAAI